MTALFGKPPQKRYPAQFAPIIGHCGGLGKFLTQENLNSNNS